jgi:group I intron endonuclease
VSPFVVYSITCRFTGMVYIGRTRNERRRKQYHFWHLRGGTHVNSHMQHACDKRGVDQFFWRVIGRYESEADAIKSEQFFIDELWDKHCLFNIAKSSRDGGSSEQVWSAEMRAKASASRRIYLSDPAVRANLSAKHMGKTLSLEHREKLRAAHAGKVLTAEHRAAMSVAQKAAWARRKLEQPA